MALHESVLPLTGEKLYVEPFCGWGWKRMDAGVSTAIQIEPAGPAPFHIVITEFYNYNGELRGATGKITEPEHVLDGRHIVFYTVYEAPLDFTSHLSSQSLKVRRFYISKNYEPSTDDYLGNVAILIGADTPTMAGPAANLERDWPLWNVGEELVIIGYAVIGVDEQAVQEYYRRILQAGAKK